MKGIWGMRALLLRAVALLFVVYPVGSAFGTVGAAVWANSRDAFGGVAVDSELVIGAGLAAGWSTVGLVLALGAAQVALRWIKTALTIPTTPMYSGDGTAASGAVLPARDRA
ncbi:hypothetical protein C5C74_12220 [Rathayibacter sp. AY1E8]|uniref:hypothetical protein n=1 Tax=unclassified Rathayibacter TaxID=2609250 RepID=UPI000CE845A4|nr:MULTISPECIES: hypothetical protein [unclassified Rathayibacter]PPF67727.1 hypothetical protein C5C46_15275 [Rathayibacter sp. AY1E6]PPG16385.1 hypothetical protein C5C74_12220 [Rathayibacter sp. AY1E8]PPH84420.1 hypothetical protein C5C82_14395 [Rathayibacter sp. AY1D5]